MSHPTIPAPTLVSGKTLDQRGPYRRERRRQLEQQGLFPPRIPLSSRFNVWPLHEVEAVERAILAGQSNDDIRALVRYLADQRKVAA